MRLLDAVRTCRRRSVAALLGGALCASFAVVTAAPAVADTNPPSGTPATVSADGLAAPQTNGVVWSVLVVGNTAFATGNFTSPRSHMLAFDVRNGALITAFNHTFNGQGLVLAASPDQKRVFVGGDFTTVDGAAHNRIAVFDAASYRMSSTFLPRFDNTVRALAITSSAVYAGGDFSSISGVARAHIAGLTQTGGITSFNPGANGNVLALTMSANGTRVYAGGRFSVLGGGARYGIGDVDTKGALLAFPANFPIRDYGQNAAVYSLSHDARTIYLTGYDFNASAQEGNFEGRAAFNPSTAAMIFVDDCHGDSYATFPVGDVLYSAGHSHDCTTQGAFPETNPRTTHHALASTTYATHPVLKNQVSGYADFSAYQAPTQLDWYPDLPDGTFTGQNQAAWTVSGNADYIVMGGEFPSVNGVAQVGLTRFAVRSLTTNKIGPKSMATPTLTPQGGGKVLVQYNTTWDPDSGSLIYRIYRDGAIVNSTAWDTRFWRYDTTINFTDSNVPAGQHSYFMTVLDRTSNQLISQSQTVTTT